MKHKLAGLILMTGLGLLSAGGASAQISLGVRIGPPPPVRVERVRPARPGEGFVWVNGYWYPQGNRYAWHQGYWTRPPYEGAIWTGPRYDGQRFVEGRWEGGHGVFAHDHQWDRDRTRDYGRYHNDNHDRDDHGHGNDDHGHDRR